MTIVNMTATTLIPNLIAVVEFQYKEKHFSVIVPMLMLHEDKFCENLIEHLLGFKSINLVGGWNDGR